MAGPVGKTVVDAKTKLLEDFSNQYRTIQSTQPEFLKKGMGAEYDQLLKSLFDDAWLAFKAKGIPITRANMEKEIRTFSALKGTAPEVTVESIYAKFTEDYADELKRLKRLGSKSRGTEYNEILDRAEEAFKDAKVTNSSLKVPTREEIERELFIKGTAKVWLQDGVIEACDKIMKLLKNESLTARQYELVKAELGNGTSVGELWNVLRQAGVKSEIISSVRAQLTSQEIADIDLAASAKNQLVDFSKYSSKGVRAVLGYIGNAIWYGKLPVRQTTEWMARAVAQPIRGIEHFTGTALYADTINPALKEWGASRGIPNIRFIYLAGAGAAAGLAYLIFGGSEEESGGVQGGAAGVKPVIARPLVGVNDALTETGASNKRTFLLHSKYGEELSRRITKKVVDTFKNDVDTQNRIFAIVRAMAFTDESFKNDPKKFIPRLEDVEPFIAAIAELSKAGKTVDDARLAAAAVAIAKYYKPEVHAAVAKDLIAYLAKNPGADVEKVLMEPEIMLKGIGQRIDKYSKSMTPEWMKRPFPIFREMGFDENAPYVKDASALIRLNFRKEDWNQVAEAMARAYREQRFELSPRDISPGSPATVPSRYVMHLEALSILMYATPEAGMQNEMPGRGLDLASAIDAVALFSRYIKQEKQYAGDEKGQRAQFNMWRMAASEMVLYKPTIETVDETVKSVLAMHPEWLRSEIKKSVIDSSPISTAIAAKIKDPQKRLAVSIAINDLFTDEYRMRAAEGVLAMIDNGMTVSEMQEKVQELAFEARTGYRGAKFNTFMDRDMESFFPAEGSEAANAARYMVATARSLHTLTTYEEYKAARDALEMFILKFRNDREAGYADLKDGKHIDPTPEIIAIAALEIVKAVRGQENVDVNKVSDAMLTSKEKNYVSAVSKLPIKQEKKRK